MTSNVSSFTFESNNENNYLTYVDPSGVLTITFDSIIDKTAIEIQGYLDYSSNDLNIVSAEKLSDNRTFEYIFYVSGEVNDPSNNPWVSTLTTRDIIFEYNENLNIINLNVNTKKPFLRHWNNESSFIDISNVTYKNRSFNFDLKYSATLFISDSSFVDYFFITNVDKLSYSVSNVKSLNYQSMPSNHWTGTVTFNDYGLDIQKETKIQTNYGNVFVKNDNYNTLENFGITINTIRPQITSIILDPSKLTYVESLGTIQLSFDKEILDSSINSFFSVSASNSDISYGTFLPIDTSNQIWETTFESLVEQNIVLDVSFGGFYGLPTFDASFEIKTEIPDVSSIIINDISHNEFTYLDTSGTLRFEFTRPYLEPSDSIINYLTYEPSQNLIIENINHIAGSSNQIWEAIVSISGEIDDSNAFVKLSYYDTSVNYDFTIDTIVPDVSSIIINDISHNEFTYLDTSGTLRFEFTRPYLEPSDSIINYLTYEPSQNLIIENINPIAGSSNQIWEAKVSISGEIDDSNAFVKLSYYDTSVNYDFTINTIVPDVSSIIINNIRNNEFTYLDTSGTIRAAFMRPYLEPSDSIINYLTYEPSQNLIIENFNVVSDSSNQIWEANISVSGEIEVSNAFIKLTYYDTSANHSLIINTLIPKIQNPENDISFNPSNITYLDLSGELSITFNKELEDTSINRFVNIDNTNVSLSNFTSTNKTKWTSILTADRDLSTNIIVSVNDFYGLDWSNNFYIDTKYPEPEYITISKTYFTYNDISGNIEFKFTKELLEPSSNILDQYLVYELSQNIIISDLRNDDIDKTKWTAIITITGEVDEDNTYIQLIYDGITKQTQNFKVKVITPSVEQISITNLLYQDSNTFTYLDGFNRNNDYKRNVYFDINFNTILEENDEIIKDKILFEPSQNIIITNFKRTDKTTKNDYNGGRYFRGEIDINGEIDVSNAFIKIDNNFYAGDASAVFHINTIIPQLEPIPNVNSSNFSVSNPIIDISFNTNYEILEDLTRDFITVSPYEYWELLYYTREEQNRKQWNTRIRYKKEITNVNNLKATIKGKYRGQSVTVDVDMSGVFPQVNSIEFQRNISNYETSDMLSYQDTSGTIVVEFTNDLSSNRIQETLSSLQQRELLMVQPKEAKLKLNLTYSEINGNKCKIVVSSKGEFKSSSSNIIFSASYLGTNKETTGLSMNTIIPRPIDISLSLLEFTENNRNAILTVTYDEVILNETVNTMEEHIGYFIKPNENIIFSDISQNQTNKKIWTANLETIGNILDSTGLIKAKYLDPTSVKSFNFLVNTVIPFVKPNIGATLQPNGLPRNRMSINLTKSKTLAEQTLIPEIHNYGPLITSNNKYNEITINGNEFHPTQLHIKIDYAGKYSQIPNKIRIKYYSPKKISFVFPQELPKGYYYFSVIRLIYVESQVGGQRFKDYKEFNSNYSYFFHKQH
jgi:hypothetical protein